MRDHTLDADQAELLEIADAAVELAIADREDAAAEGRDPITLWSLLGRDAHLLALGEQRLERALARAGSRGEA